MCSSYLPVTFCFILCKGSNKYVATCQKQFFWYLHRKMYVIIGVIFTLHGQGHFGFYDDGGGRRGKKIQLRRSDADADLSAYVFLALNRNQR